jgi:hypothetical protein
MVSAFFALDSTGDWMVTEASYCLNRELQELRWAAWAVEPKVRIIHLTMALEYSKRALVELRTSTTELTVAASG